MKTIILLINNCAAQDASGTVNQSAKREQNNFSYYFQELFLGLWHIFCGQDVCTMWKKEKLDTEYKELQIKLEKTEREGCKGTS